MIINVTHFEVRFHLHGSISLHLQAEEREKRDEYPTSAYITGKELPDFLDIISGQGRMAYCPTFMDGYYLVSPFEDAIQIIKLDTEDHYFKDVFRFPMRLLTDLHDLITEHIAEPRDGDIYEITPGMIKQYQERVKPRFHWEYQHHTDGKWNQETNQYEEWIVRDVQMSAAHWSARYPDLATQLEYLEHIAKNYSTFGEDNIIQLSFDDWTHSDDRPDSYYFCIMTPDKRRILNGGLIAHQHKHDDGTVSYEYSMHT